MKKGFLRSFCRTTKLIALRLVAGQGAKTTEEKIVFRKNYWHFLFSFKALVAHHTRIIGFISYWYCNTLARNNKKTQSFKNSLHFEFKNLNLACGETLFVGSTQAYLAHAQQISQLFRGTLGMEIRHVFSHTFLARARSPDIYNRAQWVALSNFLFWVHESSCV